MKGHNHFDIERKITATGGKIVTLDQEESYPPETHSIKRTIGCMAIVILFVALAIALYCYRIHAF